MLFNETDKSPPKNLDAERSLLGCILLDGNSIDLVLGVISENSFYMASHGKIYEAVLDLRSHGNVGIDPVTVAEHLAKKGMLADVGGVPYLMQLMEAVPHTAHARYYADIIRDKSIQRNLLFSCNEIIQECYSGVEDTDDLLSQAESKIFSILEGKTSNGHSDIRNIVDLTLQNLDKRIATAGVGTGLSSGFKDLNAQLNGFQPSELYILAARPSMGKTAFMCNLATNIAMISRKAVLMFSLEQSRTELAERLICVRTGINGHDLRAGRITPEELVFVRESAQEIRDSKVIIDDQPGKTVSQMSAISRRVKRNGDLGIIVIDYLQLIEPEAKSSPREQQIATIARRLKFMAKELDVPVLSLAQLNRGVEHRDNKRPRLSDLRESGAIEQDADVVMFLHRPEVYNPTDRVGQAELIVAKNRNGPTGDVPLTWVAESMRFDDIIPLHERDEINL